MKPTIEQLEKINLFTRRPLKADEVFVFKIRLCDTNVDKDYEKFNLDSIKKLADLYMGKSGVFNYNPKPCSARIFETNVCKFGDDGCLNAYAYMIKSENNRKLIQEIENGTKKEVSIDCAVEKVICSICGENVKYGNCEHCKGEKYFGEVCHHILENPTDAYEWSFVAVPAQKKEKTNMRTCECGKDNPQEAKFCMECGERVVSEKQFIMKKLDKKLNALNKSAFVTRIDGEDITLLLQDIRKYIEKIA